MRDTLDGTIRRTSNMNEVHFERQFNAPVESLWQFIADSPKLEKWMGGPVYRFELIDGGEVVIQIGPRFGAVASGKVFEYEPRHLVAFTWDVPAWGHTPDLLGTTMRWEAVGDGQGSKILLTHGLPYTVGREHLLAAAWHLHLDQLAQLLAGNDDHYSIEHERVKSLTAQYLDADFEKQRARYEELLDVQQSDVTEPASVRGCRGGRPTAAR